MNTGELDEENKENDSVLIKPHVSINDVEVNHDESGNNLNDDSNNKLMSKLLVSNIRFNSKR